MTSSMLSFLLALVLSHSSAYAADLLTPASIASSLNLPSHTALAFPTATLASSQAVDYLSDSSGWQITKRGHISQSEDVSFVTDPFDKSTSNPVLAIDYPAGSYSNGTGGAEFSTYFNDSSATGFQSMLLSYEVAFDSGFNFVLGGKLPGLRGGDLNGCSGGKLSTSCFSNRIMWRTEGHGESYAYIPTPNNICKQKYVLCNSDGFGTSLGRGTFAFTSGTWNNISMYVALNNPASIANGQIAIYYNGIQTLNMTGLQIRSNSSVEGFTGLFFSTFFGGNNNTWATPTEQKSYFKNFELYGSTSPSTLSGEKAVPSSALGLAPREFWAIFLLFVMGLGLVV